MSSVEVLEAKKTSYFGRMQKLYDLTKKFKTDPATVNTFLIRYETFEETVDGYYKTVEMINELKFAGDEKFAPSFSQTDAFDELSCQVKYKHKELTATSKMASTAPAATSTKKVKIPKFNLPVFSGDVEQWATYYELFKSVIHSDKDMTESEKAQYLVGSLSGKAAALLSGTPPSGSNYAKLWAKLTEKYQDERFLAHSFFKKLTRYPAITRGTSAALETFLEKFVATKDLLMGLNLADLSNFLLLEIALSKLDSETATLFENHVTTKNISGIPDFDELTKVIRDRIKILDRQDSPAANPQRTTQNRPPQESLARPRTSLVSVAANASADVSKPQQKCSMCPGEHPLYKCPQFKQMTPSDRFIHIRDKHHCCNCLSSMHPTSKCQSQRNCGTCQKRHHSLLHLSPELVTRFFSRDRGNRSDETQTSDTSPRNFCTTSATDVLIPTAQVLRDGVSRKLRILLDSASQANYITAETCKRWGISWERGHSIVSGFGSTTVNAMGNAFFVITSCFNPDLKYHVEASVVKEITNFLPASPIDRATLDIPPTLNLADEQFNTPGKIHAILGAEIFLQEWGQSKILLGDQRCYAVETTLGHVIMGKAPLAAASNSTQLSSVHIALEPRVEGLLRSFWELEDHATPSNTADKCEEIYNREFFRQNSGIYSVPLPFGDDPRARLGDSENIARKRFLNLENKLDGPSGLRSEYNKVIQDYLTAGHIEEVHVVDEPGYFIPHRGVVRADSTSTPLRIVFDASAKTSSGTSLNDIVLPGPKLQTDLRQVLIRFRYFPVALTSDIRQMYLQIEVNKEYRRYQRFFYRFHASEPLKIYQLNKVVFGISASPFLALRTVTQLLEDDGPRYPYAAAALTDDRYIDDFITSVPDEDQGYALFSDASSLLLGGGFSLAKWKTNSQSLAQKISKNLENEEMIFELDKNNTKVLGLLWSPVKDLFHFQIQIPESESWSKRTMLSVIARLHDPLGFLAPVIFHSKILMQDLWKRKIDWDQSIPPDLHIIWLRFIEELPLLEKVEIPRHLHGKTNTVVNLFAFCDASAAGYGAVIYGVFTAPNENSETALIYAKSKVSPIKEISIPRLELCGAVLLAKCVDFVVEALSTKANIADIWAFSDSKIVIHWVRATLAHPDLFIKNRIAQIRTAPVPRNHWVHIPGKENPADCLSRGLSPRSFLENATWFKGPRWMTLPKSEWPVTAIDSVYEIEPEISLVQTQSQSLITRNQRDQVKQPKTTGCPWLDLIHRRSSWITILRAAAFALRFCYRRNRPKGPLTAEEIEKAEKTLIRAIQFKSFAADIQLIQEKKDCSANLASLCPFLKDGILRVGGRLQHASGESYDSRFPVLLPKKGHAINVLINYYHRKYLHTGPNVLISLIRQKFWIIGIRVAVKQVVRACNICFRVRPKALSQIMHHLPECRVTASRAFQFTGVDYAGPFKVVHRRGRGIRPTKAYLCLFVCMTTKALHLEVASELSTDRFLDAFKRFISRRGPCSVIHSDQGKNFVGANTYLKDLADLLESTEYVTAYADLMSELRISWRFNPPYAPHFGGLWEANVKSVKNHLYRVIGEQILTFEELSTVFCQIEAVLNSRPLTALQTNPTEPSALTPAHFLTATPLKALPINPNANPTKRPQLLDAIVTDFWKRWRHEYITTLQNRAKWTKPQVDLKKGQIVLIKSENEPPLKWPIGIVEETLPGADGRVRVARVRTAKNVYTRPVVKLCVLPDQ